MSSARWLVWRGPARGSEIFLKVAVRVEGVSGEYWQVELPSILLTEPDPYAGASVGLPVIESAAVGIYIQVRIVFGLLPVRRMGNI